MSIFGDIISAIFGRSASAAPLDLGASGFPGAASFASAIRHHDKD